MKFSFKIKLIIVNPFSSQDFLIDELERCKFEYCTVISPSMTKFISSKWKNKLYLTNEDDLTSNEISFLKNYDMVLYGSDSFIILSDIISKKADIFFKNDFQSTVLRDNKYHMHEHFNKIQSPYGIKQIELEDNFDFESKLKDFSFPVVLKPFYNSIASCGISICHSFSDMYRHVNSENYDVYQNKIKYYFAQDFIAGEEYFIDTTSFNGNHVITCVCKHNKELFGNILVSLANDMWFNPEMDLEFYNIIYKMITEALDETGFLNGLAHTEFMVQADGSIKIIEINYRNSGGRGIVGKLSNYAYGTNQIDALNSLVEKREIKKFPKFQKYVTYIRIQNLCSYEKLFKKEILEFSKDYSTYKETILFAEDGEVWRSSINDANIFTHPAAIVLESEDLNAIKKDKSSIIDRMKRHYL